uniref:Probable endonuclease 4 n=1 Tax=candidate division WOR-3 bacterium TaxID=2052148 RepID=A0A7C3Z305_UNCW3
MRFGFHISIGGGLSKVLERAKKRSCETIQIFSRNPRGWRYTKLDQKEVGIFKRDMAENEIYPLFVHMPYLPNLATKAKGIFKKSVDSLITELERCEILGVPFLIMHVGKRMGATEEEGIKRVAEGINEAFRRIKNKVILLLENTAGMGSEIGYQFSQIKEIIDAVEERERIGVVLDTAHTFEAGYDLRDKEGIDKTLREFDELIGLKRLYCLHLNDSKTDFGSRVDRHWHIGKGKIGLEGFRLIVNHPLLRHLPGIMETPRDDTKLDLMNMKTIRRLVE